MAQIHKDLFRINGPQFYNLLELSGELVQPQMTGPQNFRFSKLV